MLGQKLILIAIYIGKWGQYIQWHHFQHRSSLRSLKKHVNQLDGIIESENFNGIFASQNADDI